MAAFNSDAVVYGATAQGIMAAWALTRRGKTVIIINPDAHYGGMTTSGLSYMDIGPNGARASIVGGLTRQILTSVDTLYGKPVGTLTINAEPRVYADPLNNARRTTGATTRPNETVTSVTKSGSRIVSISTNNGANTYTATQFIDASYEGDLAALAGVSMAYGREAAATFGEDVILNTGGGSAGFGSNVQFQSQTTLDANGQRYTNTGPVPKQTIQAGDAYTGNQAFNYRLILTSTAAKRQAFTAPVGYNPADYAMLLKWLAIGGGLNITKLVGAVGGNDAILGGVLLTSTSGALKYDCNTSGNISSNFLGAGFGAPNMTTAYVTGSAATRAAIKATIHRWVAGLLYFCATDSSLSGTALQADAQQYGYANDEFQTVFTGFAGFPPQLYVREARRFYGQYVMRLSDVASGAIVADPICRFNYAVDVHGSNRYARTTNFGQQAAEGGYNQPSPALPYQIPMRAMMPELGQADNLLICGTLSCTHLAWGALRLELPLMMVGEAAGLAVALAIENGLQAAAVPYGLLQPALIAQGAVW